ncbi:type III restriction-modification system methylation subunit [Klebsiella pneumoniae]|nr:type III restriction-modification system methylation subunit [Klebsiella pneumoniae]
MIAQLPELVDENTKEQAIAAAFLKKHGMSLKISEITKERLRRAGKKVREDNPDWNGDVGFRVFKLDTSKEGANKSPNIKMRLCNYLNLIN